MPLLPQPSAEQPGASQNENPLGSLTQKSQSVLVQGLPGGTRQTLAYGLQDSVLQSSSVSHAAPTSAFGTQPTPAWHRNVLGQPHTAQ
jgi:hypothetical protein